MSDEIELNHHGITEEIADRNSLEKIVEENPKMQTLTQEAVDEQIRGFFAPLTRQLEELTRLVQEMSNSRHPISYPRTELGDTSGTAMPQSNIGRFISINADEKYARSTFELQS